jgi:hypothetical protein
MYRIRHQLILALVLLLGTAALASAQGDHPEQDDESQDLPLLVAPSHMITGEWEPLTLEEVDPSEVPVINQNQPGSDLCTDAPSFNVPGGTQAVTNNNTISSSDPVLACMWGSPGSQQGYRTTWFRFTSTYSGRVIISTAGSTFDTVLAVYSGGCASPTQLACNDDYNYFSVKHVDTVHNRVHEIPGRTDSHQITGSVGWQRVSQMLYHGLHLVFWLAD